MLVFVRKGSKLPITREQPVLEKASPNETLDLSTTTQTWIQARLADAVRIARGHNFPAKSGPRCRGCGFTVGCPVNARGGRSDE